MFSKLWGGAEPSILDLEPGAFDVFSYLCRFAGHQSSKPDVIAQLEREERLWGTELQTQRGRLAGEHLAPLSCCALDNLTPLLQALPYLLARKAGC